MILADSSVWVDFFRHQDTPPVLSLTELIEGEQPLAICGPILTEVLQGFRLDSVFAEAAAFFEKLHYLDISRNTHLHAARIYRALRKQGLTISSSTDCLIAACAIEHKAHLLHDDRDFEKIARVSDLRVAGP